jgi:hypothetical protein
MASFSAAVALIAVASETPALPEEPAALILSRELDGGEVKAFADRVKKLGYFWDLREVRILEPCWSACTFYLSHPNLCVGERAVFYFHAPRDKYTNKVSADFESYLLPLYPEWVRKWIAHQGGISHDWTKYLILSNSYARQFVRACEKEPWDATAARLLKMGELIAESRKIPIPRPKPAR